MSNIQITLDEHERGYRSGERISGNVVWKHEPSKKNKPVRVNLIFYTEGRGSRDVEIVDTLELPIDQKSANFSFLLTGDPPSFSGALISLSWAIEAVLPSPKSSDKVDFIVSESGKPVHLNEIKQDKDKPKFLRKLFKQ